MGQALFWDFRLMPAAGGRRISRGFGGSGAYFVALEVWFGARVGLSIALPSSQTRSHNITTSSLSQGEVMSSVVST
jgi:hypothetical protein